MRRKKAGFWMIQFFDRKIFQKKLISEGIGGFEVMPRLREG